MLPGFPVTDPPTPPERARHQGQHSAMPDPTSQPEEVATLGDPSGTGRGSELDWTMARERQTIIQGEDQGRSNADKGS